MSGVVLIDGAYWVGYFCDLYEHMRGSFQLFVAYTRVMIHVRDEESSRLLIIISMYDYALCLPGRLYMASKIAALSLQAYGSAAPFSLARLGSAS